MSILCGLPLLECVYCLACARWAWKRCLHTAGHDSETWGLATAEEFEPVPRICCYILAVYEDDLRRPLWEPPEGYGINPDWLVLKRTYEDTKGQAPPYILYLDHDHADIVLAFRGLNLAKESDYAVLLDNKLGKRKFDGGYVHNGLLKAAGWVLQTESDILKDLVERYPNYTLTFAGHSLGSGVAALLTMVAVQNRDKLGNIDRKRIRCYAIAPARCMSLNLAVRYADVINSVVLQDDFLPRTATPLEDIFKSLFCLPCLLCLRCMRDTCIPEEKMLKDPRRLYAPGRLYHIVERKPFRMGRFPPVVRTAVPVDGRFEHIVLSCNATSDHAIIWIEREARRALELVSEKDHIMEIPAKQRMERQETLAKEKSEEYKAALQRAVTLAVPHAYSPSQYGTFDDEGGSSAGSTPGESSFDSSRKTKGKETWDELIERLFDKDDSGHITAPEAEYSFSKHQILTLEGFHSFIFSENFVGRGISVEFSGISNGFPCLNLSPIGGLFFFALFFFRNSIPTGLTHQGLSSSLGNQGQAQERNKKSSRDTDDSGDTIQKGLLNSSGPPQQNEDDVVSSIEERISAWTFLPKENGKALQVLHYENEDSEKNLNYFGNSSLLDHSKPLIATVVLYLSNVTKGGQILFPQSQVKGKIWSDCTKSSGKIPRPIKGNAILFFNLYPNTTSDSSSSHARCPVVEGEMWFATKFFQVKSTAGEKLSLESDKEECTDQDENCPGWAAMGECQRNPVFMVGSPDYYGTCRESCNAC
ncbi:Mono-/di-acylglycerol lipase [Parasponia andersonii]|uniref:procollagen-proline 4-dioxygenase n=1 Tax=Parasponia andersonii TaxID=3476 RepID=A0A2P5BSE2_PARAD|nr:Mono-/di-acylglycerol lipase [Parasponia andersonii]